VKQKRCAVNKICRVLDSRFLFYLFVLIRVHPRKSAAKGFRYLAVFIRDSRIILAVIINSF
jgi:hypothetical protein